MRSELRIIIANDRHAELQGIKADLLEESALTIASAVEQPGELFSTLEKSKADIILISDFFPDITEVIKSIKEKFLLLKILLLVTAYAEEQIKIAAHAHGVVPKNGGRDELVKAILHIAEHGEYFTAEFKEMQFKLSRKEKARESLQIVLTNREKEILQSIFLELKPDEIESRFGIKKSTIKFHRKNLYQKLGVNSVVGCIKKAQQLGLL